MKIKLLFICFILVFSINQSEAQFGKGGLEGMFKKSKKKVERKIEKEVENKIDETLDDAVEEVLTPKEEKEKAKKEAEEAAEKERTKKAVTEAKKTLEDQAKRLQVMLKEGGVDSPYLEGDLKRFRQNLDGYIEEYPNADFTSEENFYADFSEKYNDLK